MHCDILLSIFLELLQNRRTTARELSQKHGISPRTVYRYVEKLSAFLPLFVQRGRTGGICLADNFRLPTDFFTAEEYAAAIDGLTLAYEHAPSAALLSAKRKLYAQERKSRPRSAWAQSGEILLLPMEESFAEILNTARACIREKRLLKLLYRTDGKAVEYTVEPHVLVLRKEWYLYAFCYAHRRFCAFPLQALEGVKSTKERFRLRRIEENQILSAIPGTE